MKRQKRSKKTRLCLFLGVLLAVQCLFLPATAQTEVYRSVKTDGMQIAITFDDGPHPMQTRRILEILDRYAVKATFFMVGVNVVNYPTVAAEVIARGHEVGNHTYSHDRLKELSGEAISREIGLCEDVLEELFEYRPHLFRPPQGAISTFVEHCTEHHDYTMILWSLDTRDWECRNTDAIVESVLSNIKPGDIILMHDYIGRESKTPEALEILLPQLIERGFEPVTVSRLLGVG